MTAAIDIPVASEAGAGCVATLARWPSCRRARRHGCAGSCDAGGARTRAADRGRLPGRRGSGCFSAATACGRDAATAWLVRTAIREAVKHDAPRRAGAVARRLDASETRRTTRRPAARRALLDELVEQRARLESIGPAAERQQRLVWLQGLGLSYTEMAAPDRYDTAHGRAPAAAGQAHAGDPSARARAAAAAADGPQRLARPRLRRLRSAALSLRGLGGALGAGPRPDGRRPRPPGARRPGPAGARRAR